MLVSGTLCQLLVKSLGFHCLRGSLIFGMASIILAFGPLEVLSVCHSRHTRERDLFCFWLVLVTGQKLKKYLSADRGFGGLDGVLTETACPDGSAPNLE